MYGRRRRCWFFSKTKLLPACTLCGKLNLLQKKGNVADAERLLLYVLQSQPRVKKVKNKFRGATICIKIKFPHNLFQQRGSNIKYMKWRHTI